MGKTQGTNSKESIMSHFQKDSGPPDNWWLHGQYFRLLGTLQNYATNPFERIEVEFEVGPYWLAHHEKEPEDFESDEQVSLAPNTRFLIDTGAKVSVLKGDNRTNLPHAVAGGGTSTLLR
jgi:hypothetical protein